MCVGGGGRVLEKACRSVGIVKLASKKNEGGGG